MDDGRLAVVKPRDALAGVAEYGEHLLLAEGRLDACLHQPQHAVGTVRHQQQHLVDAAAHRRQARVHVADDVFVSIQITLKQQQQMSTCLFFY